MSYTLYERDDLPFEGFGLKWTGDPAGEPSDGAEYRRRLDGLLSGFAKYVKGNNADEIQSIIAEATGQLRKDAERFIGGQPAREVIYRSYLIEGILREQHERVSRAQFTIREVRSEYDPSLYDDLEIDVGPKGVSSSKQDLQLEIQRVLTAIKVLFGRNERTLFAASASISPLDDKPNFYRRVQDWLRSTWSEGRARRRLESRIKLDEYVRKLAGIARLGLTGEEHVSFASLALSGLKDEILAREAGAVKNDYIRRLGLWAACVACILLLALVLISPDGSARAFVLVGLGTCLGTWLSFSLRRVKLTFSDLAVLEEDRLNPGVRILFMLGLTSVLGMLFSVKAVGIELGDFKTSGISSDPLVPLLIGALAGIAERALATAVTIRADQFIGGVSGSTTTRA
jgi:hypothetical protein